MIGRLAIVLAAAVFLAGCTDADWDHALAYAGLGSDKAAQTSAAASAATPAGEATPPAPQTAAADGWCTEVAKAAEAEAAGQGFDKQTQKNRAQAAFQQCAHGQGVVANQ